MKADHEVVGKATGIPVMTFRVLIMMLRDIPLASCFICNRLLLSVQVQVDSNMGLFAKDDETYCGGLKACSIPFNTQLFSEVFQIPGLIERLEEVNSFSCCSVCSETLQKFLTSDSFTDNRYCMQKIVIAEPGQDKNNYLLHRPSFTKSAMKI